VKLSPCVLEFISNCTSEPEEEAEEQEATTVTEIEYQLRSLCLEHHTAWRPLLGVAEFCTRRVRN
jgi:hypothetical protein